jgi:MFS superfamily sulfate permease-like transporter
MTDEPIEFFEDDQPPQRKRMSRGLGCFLGGVAVVGSAVSGAAFSALLFYLVGQTDLSAPVSTITSLIPLGLLVFAGVYWRKVPGFLLGIALTIGISIVIVGACTALLFTQMG